MATRFHFYAPGLDRLERDLAGIPKKAAKDQLAVVRSNLKQGNLLARGFAKQSAGSHGKRYPRAFSSEVRIRTLELVEGEYGPDAAMPQGGMSFERGSRNQPPHLDLAKSADIIGPKFAHDVSELPDKWFW